MASAPIGSVVGMSLHTRCADLESIGRRRALVMLAAAFAAGTSGSNARATLPQRRPPTLDEKVRAASHVFVGKAERVAFVDLKTYYREPFEIFDTWAEGRGTTLLVRVVTPLMPTTWTDEKLIRIARFGVSPSRQSPFIGKELIFFTQRETYQPAGKRPFIQFLVPTAGEGLRALPEELTELAQVKQAIDRRLAHVAKANEKKPKSP